MNAFARFLSVLSWTAFCVACLFQVSCVVTRLEIAAVEYEETDAPITVQSPVKAHLEDGSTVVYSKGVTIEDGIVKGQGFKYDITLDHGERVTEVDLDDVAAMESYQTPMDIDATIVGSAAVTAVATAVLATACPSSNKWNRGSDFLVESFVPHFQFTRRVVGSANGVSRWSFS